MPLMDEFKKEREDIKNQPLKKRLDYFWTYYKWWVIGGIALIIIAVSIITNIVKSKDETVYVAMIDTVINPTGNYEENITVPFLEEHGLSPKKNTINFNLNFIFSGQKGSELPGSPSYSDTLGYSGRQNLAIYVSAGDVDAISAPEDWFDNYAYSDFFLSLDDYLSADELKALDGRICYADRAVMERFKKAHDEDNYEYSEEFPDSTDPSSMEDPVPVGIYIDDCPLFNENFACADDNSSRVVIGIVRNSPAVEITKDLIIYITGKAY